MNRDHDGGELSAEARALVSIGAAGDEPSAADRARMRTRLLTTIAGGVAGSATTLAAAKTSAASQLGSVGSAGVAGHAAGAASLLGGKLGVGVLVTALAITSGFVGMRALRNTDGERGERTHTAEALPTTQLAQGMPVEPRLAPQPGKTAPSQAVLPAAEPEHAVIAAPVIAEPAAAAPAAEPAAAPEALPTPAAASRARSATPRTHARSRAAERSRLAATSPSTSASSAPAATSATQLPANVEPAASAQAGATDATTAVARPEQALAPSLRRELAPIAAAQSSLAQNQPEQALRLLDEHAAGFATGSLVQERLAARAVALCALGRTAEGRRSVMDLARLAPSSPLLGRARRACGASTP